MEKEIKFEDIRVGDTIRREWKALDLLNTETGTVATLTKRFAYTAKHVMLAGAKWDGSTYILVDRPKQPLPTEPGSVIIATKVRGVKGRWTLLISPCGDWVSSGYVNDYSFHFPDDIQEWRPAEIFEVTP